MVDANELDYSPLDEKKTGLKTAVAPDSPLDTSILRKAWRFLTGRRVAATPVQHRRETRATGINVGCTEPVCPHCQQRLEMMPVRKKKCPSCGQFIYVRTRPADRAKVLVTEAQAAVIEQQWVDHHSEQETARLRGLPGYEQARTQLLRSTSREPTGHEVALELANRELAVYRDQRQWGLYCNAKLQLAKELRMLGRKKASLAAYLEACYLDLNGPANVVRVDDPENLLGMDDLAVSAEFPPFRPGDAWLSPMILEDVKDLQRELGMNLVQIKNTFLSTAAANHRSLNLPVSPEAAWRQLSRELSGKDE
ncbi:MAG: hypothetical protein NTX53_19505 [candidate division WOR-3 bacterium]|nr:hypothetical protein [candidate division WOR-3 bacterium]